MQVRFFVLIAAPIPCSLSHPEFSYCAYAASYRALVDVTRFMESQASCQPSIIWNVYTDYPHLTVELLANYFLFKRQRTPSSIFAVDKKVSRRQIGYPV